MRKCLVSLGILVVFIFSSFINPYGANASSKNVSEDYEILKEIDIYLDELERLLSVEVGTDDAETEYFINNVNKVRGEVEQYISDIKLSESFNSPIFNELIEKLGQLDLKVDPYINNEPKTRAASWRYGDILYYGIGSNNAVGEKSFTGHTAVLSTTDYYVIEASKTKNNGAKVHHWNRSNLWKGASGIKQYKVTNKLGTNATTTERKKAVTYGLNQVGEPYALKTTLSDTSKWYCSKLTNAQWDSVGYNLQSVAGFTLAGIIAVIPAHIVADMNVRLVKNWGTTLPVKM